MNVILISTCVALISMRILYLLDQLLAFNPYEERLIMLCHYTGLRIYAYDWLITSKR
jgi:hypothetical protein